MVLGKLPVPGRPTIWITVGQGPTALAVGAGGGCLDIFTLIYPFFPLSPSLWETARYRLKYCLKGPLNPRPTNQPTTNQSVYIIGPSPRERGGGRVLLWCWVNSQCRGVLLIWIIAGQGPTALAVGAGGGCLDIFSLVNRGWSGGAMVLGKLPVPGRPTILITVGQGPIALAVGAGGGGLDILLSSILSLLSPSLWETARYRLKYCLKGPLNPKPTNQPTNQRAVKPKTTKSLVNHFSFLWLVGSFRLNGPLIQYFSLYKAVSHREGEKGWLVGCFGFNGPLRQYFSLYRAVSQREGQRGKKG